MVTYPRWLYAEFQLCISLLCIICVHVFLITFSPLYSPRVVCITTESIPTDSIPTKSVPIKSISVTMIKPICSLGNCLSMQYFVLLSQQFTQQHCVYIQEIYCASINNIIQHTHALLLYQLMCSGGDLS